MIWTSRRLLYDCNLQFFVDMYKCKLMPIILTIAYMNKNAFSNLQINRIFYVLNYN